VHVFKRGEKGAREPAGGAYVRVSDGQGMRGSGQADARGILEAPVPPGQASVLAELDGHFAVYRE
jgi:hypothetical protein